jgi:uncharacterized protein YqhQ
MRGALHLLCQAAKLSVGGQAVMEGVMMRSGNRLAIAVRKVSGEIKVETRPWFSFAGAWGKRPFLRGFPILVETLVNGISALNYSAQEALDGETEGQAELGPWAMAGTVAAALGLALGLFVVLPHLVSLAMKALGLSGGVESLSFHLWDGLFKLLVFLGYILAISLVPDIRRVFQYHGAEHKAIWAFESGDGLTPDAARGYSRLHPRCGTTFLLFVLGLSIVLYAVLIPLLLHFWSPAGAVLRHAYILGVKLVLMIPVSCLAYELIKFAGRFHENPACKAMSAPGMLMQLLTTHEPDDAQLEVAIKALEGAVGPDIDIHVRQARKS